MSEHQPDAAGWKLNLFGGWGGGGGSAAKATKAHLGEKNRFYYNENLKRWIVEGEEEDALKEMNSSSGGPPILSNANTNGNGLSSEQPVGGAGMAVDRSDMSRPSGANDFANGPSDAINGMMMPFGNPASTRPANARGSSLRSRYVDPLSSKSTSTGSSVSNTPNSSFSNLIPSTNANNFGNFNNGLVPGSASMFVPAPAAVDGGNEHDAAAVLGGTTATEAFGQQPAFFVPQNTFVPAPAPMDAVRSVPDDDNEPAASTDTAQVAELSGVMNGNEAAMSSTTSGAAVPPHDPYVPSAAVRAESESLGAEGSTVVGSVSYYSNDLGLGGGAVMPVHDVSRDAPVDHGGDSLGVGENRAHEYAIDSRAYSGDGMAPPLNEASDSGVYNVPNVKTSFTQDNMAYARVGVPGSIPFANSPYHNRSKSGSDFFRSINNVTPDSDAASNGMAQSPLRSSGPVPNGETAGGGEGEGEEGVAADWTAGTAGGGADEAAALPSDGMYTGAPHAGAGVSRSSFDTSYYYHSTDAYGAAALGSSSTDDAGPMNFVIGARDEGVVEGVASSSDPVALGRQYSLSTDSMVLETGDSDASVGVVPTDAGFMQPSSTATARSSFDAGAGGVQSVSTRAEAEAVVSAPDLDLRVNDGAADSVGAVAATAAAVAANDPLRPGNASFVSPLGYPPSPPPGYGGIAEASASPSPPPPPPPLSFPPPPPPAAAAYDAHPSSPPSGFPGNASDGSGPSTKRGISPIVDDTGREDEEQEVHARGGLTLPPPQTPSFAAPVSPARRMLPMSPTTPVPSVAGSYLSPTPFRTLQSLATAVESEEHLRAILEMETRIHQYQHELQQQQQRIEAQDSELDAARRQYQDYYYQQYQRDIVAQQAQFEAVIAAERRLREEAMEQVQLLLQQQRQSADGASTSGAAHAPLPPGANAAGEVDEDDEGENGDAMADLLCCLGQESRKVLVLSNELRLLGVDVDPLLSGIDEDFTQPADDDAVDDDDEGDGEAQAEKQQQQQQSNEGEREEPDDVARM